MLKVVQITDCHLGSHPETSMHGVTPFPSLTRILEQVVTEKPDFIVGSGDLSEEGCIPSYKLLQSALNKTKIPYALIPGNHDIIPNLLEVFKQETLIDKALSMGAWQFLFLNSPVKGKHYGYLSQDTLDFLEVQLKAGAQNIGVFVHHHPLAVNNRFLNEYGIKNDEAFRILVEQYKDQVKFVSFGHIHSEFNKKLNGITYYGSPATSVQFREGLKKVELDFNSGYRVFNLGENGSVETQAKILGSLS